jgi:2-keto-4-pentenoate hydratase/2-oxohepta-3-ene-1,7-dioic acid hydratase in catechol pathway
MKLVRFSIEGKIRYGILHKDIIQAIKGNPFHGIHPLEEYFDIGKVRLLSPCRPSKIIAVGINYHSHAKEFEHNLPENPLLFLKPPTAVIGPEDNIVYPTMSEQVDYEGELGIIIGKRVHHINPDTTKPYILGYTCFNDITARDLQKKDGQWTRAKGFDTIASIGPCIETDIDPSQLELQTFLNGELKQKASTNLLIFKVNQLVSFISDVMTLLPGDVIASGTPSGVGPMKPGDTIEVNIHNIGTLRNHVIKQN